ncbi:MAG: NEW3 domain-containing protein, partial [Actinomycetes bacterium]
TRNGGSSILQLAEVQLSDGDTTRPPDYSDLVDNSSATGITFASPTPFVQYRANGPAEQATFYTLTSGPVPGDAVSWVLKGSSDGQAWVVIDQRSGQTFPWRSQTRAFKIAKPGKYGFYRIEVTANTGEPTVTLAEIELLGPKLRAAQLAVEVTGGVAAPGDTIAVEATVTNDSTRPASGEVTAAAPAGWEVQPASVEFGPIGGGAAETATFQVTVPAGAAPGTYPIDVSVTSERGTAQGSGDVQVIDDVIEFTPGTAAEEPWLSDADGSQLDGTVFDGRARFADGSQYFVYRFQLPSAVTGGQLTIDVGNQFLVRVSTDGENWQTILEEAENVRDLSNRQEHVFDLNELREGSQTLYVRFGDSQTADGWGAWLARLRLEMQLG